MPRHSIAVGLAVAGALAAGLCATASSEASGEAASPTARTVASITTSDFRVDVSAARRGGGSVPEATVTVRTFERQRGEWRRTGVHRLSGSYFWKTVIGPRAVCRLEIRTAGSGLRFRPRALVQLLLSPSLGCGPPVSYPLSG